jgi:hypothetical protein
MMGDFFWDVATSYVVLSAIGLILAAALIVGYFPLLKWFPVIGQYVPVARLVVILSAALLCFLVGFRASDERAEAKSLRLQLEAKQTDIDAANDAAKKADAARAELAEQAKADQERIADYAEQLKKRPNGACTLGPDDFDGMRDDGKRAR